MWPQAIPNPRILVTHFQISMGTLNLVLFHCDSRKRNGGVYITTNAVILSRVVGGGGGTFELLSRKIER